MTNEQAELIAQKATNRIAKNLDFKAKDYAANEDRLHKFKQIGIIARMVNPSITDAQVLLILGLKHFVCMLDNWDVKKPSTWEDEKIGDWDTYMVLYEMMRREEGL